MKNVDMLNDCARIEALHDMQKMWMWLSRHPAHNQKYYVSHVAKLDQPWKNDCPICHLAGQKCSDCLMQGERQNGTFCTDSESPFRKWQETALDNPDYRTFYAGEIIALAQTAKGRFTAG